MAATRGLTPAVLSVDPRRWQEPIESLYAISLEITGLHRLESVMDPRVAGAVIERLKSPRRRPSHPLPPHQVSVPRHLGARNRLEAVMIASRRGWL